MYIKTNHYKCSTFIHPPTEELSPATPRALGRPTTDEFYHVCRCAVLHYVAFFFHPQPTYLSIFNDITTQKYVKVQSAVDLAPCEHALPLYKLNVYDKFGLLPFEWGHGYCVHRGQRGQIVIKSVLIMFVMKVLMNLIYSTTCAFYLF